jgi:selenoprotein W-related protein
LEGELRRRYGFDLDITLVAGAGGVFEVVLDGRLLFSKRQLGRFPQQGEVERLLSANGG